MKKRWVKGYEGKLAVDWHGKAYRMTNKGLKQAKAKNYISIDGKQLTIARIVWETFKGPIPKGLQVRHKSIKTDHALPNLTLGKAVGAIEKRKPVAKIDKYGEIVALYPSISECARKNNLSENTIWNHCSGKYYRNGKAVKIPDYVLCKDGYKYRFMEE